MLPSRMKRYKNSTSNVTMEEALQSNQNALKKTYVGEHTMMAASKTLFLTEFHVAN